MIYRRSGLAILAVSFLALLAGIALMLGRRENDPLLFRVLGSGVVLGMGAVLCLTVQRWAGYFFAVCVIAAVKAVLALVFGVTVSTRHLVTDRSLVLKLLGLLAALSFLTYRFVTQLPRSTLQAVSLVLALIGLAWAMLTEPNYWPLCMSVGVLGIAWVAEGFL
ncbi:MAG: hypothetical protein ABSG13_06110 [Bryobacteraceae bacterium]|jgi:hypothetical protein